MAMTPEDRLWEQLFSRLDKLDQKLDDKVNYRTFNQSKEELNGRIDELEEELAQIRKSAVSPDQVVTLIGDKLKESDARLVTNRDRWIRWGVAGTSIGAFALLVFDRATNG